MSSILVSAEGPTYPPLLAAAFAARDGGPPILRVRGVLPSAPGVAVIGTRDPHPEAIAFTRMLVLGLAQAGFSIWSGGALGIDAAAHEAALEAGAPTVVALAGGLERLYPRDHVSLFDRILGAGGALVALVDDDVQPAPHRFLARNEILAAAAHATVVVEAGYKSGARNAAAAARRFGRPLCAVPHAPWDPKGQGCALEITRGASAIVSADDVVDAIRRSGDPAALIAARSVRRRRVAVVGLAPSAATSPASPSRPSSAEQVDLPLARVTRTRAADVPARSRALARDQLSSSIGLDVRPEVDTLPALDEDERVVLAALFTSSVEAPLHLDEICDRAQRSPPAVVTSLLTLTLAAIVVEGPAGFFRRSRCP